MYQLEPFSAADRIVSKFPKVSCDLTVSSNRFFEVSLEFSISDPNEQIDFTNNKIGLIEPIKARSVLNQRRNEIWKATCFEAFLKSPKSSEYLELNFNPDGDWNCYHFQDCRLPQPPQEVPHVVSVFYSFEKDSSTFRYDIRLDSNFTKTFSQLSTLDVGLTSILLMKDKSKNYFALRHTAEKPDFHKPDSFIINKIVNRK